MQRRAEEGPCRVPRACAASGLWGQRRWPSVQVTCVHLREPETSHPSASGLHHRPQGLPPALSWPLSPLDQRGPERREAVSGYLYCEVGDLAASNIFFRPSIPDMASTFFLQSPTSTGRSCGQTTLTSETHRACHARLPGDGGAAGRSHPRNRSPASPPGPGPPSWPAQRLGHLLQEALLLLVWLLFLHPRAPCPPLSRGSVSGHRPCLSSTFLTAPPGSGHGRRGLSWPCGAC